MPYPYRKGTIMPDIYEPDLPICQMLPGEWKVAMRALHDAQQCVQQRVKPLLPGVAEELTNSLESVESLFTPNMLGGGHVSA